MAIATEAQYKIDHIPGFVGLQSGSQAPPGSLPKSVNALQNALGQANRYPFAFFGEPAEEIGALHRVQPNQIVLGCGSSEILRMTAMALLGSTANS